MNNLHKEIRPWQATTRLAATVSLSVLMVSLAVHAQAAKSAAAQAQVPSDDLSGSLSGDIVVTGSRLQGDFSAPTPLTTSSADQLRALAPTDLPDGLKQFPVFGGNLKTSNPGTTPGMGDSGQNLLNLRGLGTNRNLVLLNGSRAAALASRSRRP